MKKICFVTTIFLTYKSFLRQFTEYLWQTGEYDISLICNDEEGLKEQLPEYVHYYPVHMERGISLSAFSAISNIKKIIKEQKFDIVQYSTPNAAFYTSIAAKSAKTPVRLYCQWGIRYMGFEGLSRKIFKVLEKITCMNSTFVEAESHNIRDFSLSENLYKEDKSCVVWNGSACGVDLSKIDLTNKLKWRKEVRDELNIKEDDIVFSFAARLTADKGINELLKAFFELEKKYDNIKLVVMGGMDQEGTLNQDLMKKAKQSADVHLLGNVNDVERYYAASDVFISPSYREGFGLVVIEAEAMGLPAIVTDVPGQIDAIDPNVTGLSCKVKDSQSLMQAMEKLVTDEKMRISMGEKAVKFVGDNFEQKKLFLYLKENRDNLLRR